MTDVVTLTLNPAIDVNTGTDQVVPEHKLRCREPWRQPGGGGINVARALANLGERALAIYPAGGPSGQILSGLLADAGLAQWVVPIACMTRVNFTVDESSSGLQYRFVMPGPPLAETDWRRCLEAIAGLNPVPRWLVASGSLPLAVPDTFYAELARIAHGIGTHLVLDTSGPALAAALEEGVFLVKPNKRELEALTGEPADTPDAQERLSRRLVEENRAAVVALTLGAGGALLTSAAGAVRLPALDVPVRSTVGAGDSFLAGLVFGLVHGWTLEQAFRYGVAAGAAALMTPGTSLCRRSDVEALFDRLSTRRRAAS